ncbi:MAG: ketopantoate reductase family protein [Dehalococcoidia bacterium]|nr:ketopantoate reductase family protein [Dehalococcoidia bacterium]
MGFNKILVVGGGAIGGITAALLTRQGLNVIVLDADQEHVKRMNSGLEISGFRELIVPVKAMLPGDFGGTQNASWADTVLLAVKGLHTENALKSILPVISKTAPVVSLQNGINEETISKIVGVERTIACSITWGSTNKGPGQLMQTTDGGFIIGQWPTGKSKIVEDTAALLSKACNTEISDNIIGDRWTKLLITASLTGVGTTAGLTYGGVIENEAARKVALTVITETYDVGIKAGVKFADLMGVSPSIVLVRNKADFEKASQLMEIGFANHKATKPSMWQDIEKGRKTEVDFVNGYVVRKGKEVGLKTPANELVTKVIKEIEEGKRKPSLENLKEFQSITAYIK